MIDVREALPIRVGARHYYLRAWAEDPYNPKPWEIQAAEDKITGGTIHYTAGPDSQTVQQIAQYQTGPGAQEAFPAIAYTFYIDKQGRIYWCHDFAIRSWHSGAVVAGIPRNVSHLSYCYAGNSAPNPKQIEGLGKAIAFSERRLERAITIEGHGDSMATTCPGPTWPVWRAAVMAARGAA